METWPKDDLMVTLTQKLKLTLIQTDVIVDTWPRCLSYKDPNVLAAIFSSGEAPASLVLALSTAPTVTSCGPCSSSSSPHSSSSAPPHTPPPPYPPSIQGEQWSCPFETFKRPTQKPKFQSTWNLSKAANVMHYFQLISIKTLKYLILIRILGRYGKKIKNLWVRNIIYLDLKNPQISKSFWLIITFVYVLPVWFYC